MICSVCRARNDTGPTCRRCRADLSPLFAVARQRNELLRAIHRAAGRGDWGEVSRLAEEAARLRRGPEVARWQAVAALMRHDFTAAWRLYREARGNAAPAS